MIENFDKLSFDRKVDVLVAEHVMGWKDVTIELAHKESAIQVWKCKGKDQYRFDGYVPMYSLLLNSTWDIVRRFSFFYLYNSERCDFILMYGPRRTNKDKWECKLRDDITGRVFLEKDSYFAWAETAELAICFAALKAVGYDIKGFLEKEKKI
jgi:Phage ABA sandwich domain